MKTLLDMMRDALPEDSADCKSFIKLCSKLYKQDKNGFYVYVPPIVSKKEKLDMTNREQIVKYMMRHTGRPAMAQSRIVSLDKTKHEIRYWYDDHKTKEHIEVQEHVFKLILKLIQHIPDKQFKITRYYGLYATANHKHRKPVRNILKLRQSFSNLRKRKFRYRKLMIDTFNVDPLLYMFMLSNIEYVDSYIPPHLRGGGELP